MTITEWKCLARLSLESYPSDAKWEEVTDALLRASENEGLPLLDQSVEELS